jgi:hypothetical protein
LAPTLLTPGNHAEARRQTERQRGAATCFAYRCYTPGKWRGSIEGKVQIRVSPEKNTNDEQSHERLNAFTRLSTQTNPPELAVVTLNVALIVV